MKNKKSKYRSNRGQAMGVVDLMIVVPVVIGAVLLLANVGMAVFYKQKLALVSNQTAVHLAGLPASLQTDQEAQAFVASMCKQLEMPTTQLKAVVTKISIQGRTSNESGVKVVITDDVNLLGGGNSSPMKTSLTDSAIAWTALGQMN